MRHRLRKDYGIEGGIPVVFSIEKPKAKLLPFRGPSGEEENPSDYQVRMLLLLLKFQSTLFSDYCTSMEKFRLKYRNRIWNLNFFGVVELELCFF